jgi:hypothetical protein
VLSGIDMAIDYVKMAATAQRLISTNGRIITLLKFAPSTDIQKPWRGPNPVLPLATLDRSAVTVSVSLLKLGQTQVSDDLLKRVTDVAWVACDGEDLIGYDAIIEDGKQYSIEWVQQLKPATIPLVAYVGYNK